MEVELQTTAQDQKAEDPKEIHKRNTERLAAFIEFTKQWFDLFDISFARQACQDMYNKAHMMDSAAALQTNYNPDNSRLMVKQADTLKYMIDYVEGMIECGKMKTSITQYNQKRDSINRLFM